MTALFTSFVCDWCDGIKKPIAVDRGYVIWLRDGEAGPRDLYVFPTRDMADYYKRVSNTDGDLREVLSETPIRWWTGEGSLRHLQRSECLYTIYPDYRFEPGPFRAFLAPESAKRRAA